MAPKRPPPLALPSPGGVAGGASAPAPTGTPLSAITGSASVAAMASKEQQKQQQTAATAKAVVTNRGGASSGTAGSGKATEKTAGPSPTGAKPTTATRDASSGPQSLPIVDRKKVLWVMCLLKIITSYDSGAYGAVLGIDDGIAQALRLSVVDEGALGSAPFIGNTIGCAIAGVLFSRYEAKPLLLIGMGLHLLFTALFALSPTFMIALVSRIMIGFTLSFVVVYSVVWTDVFAPPANATTWLAMMNAGVPLGMLLGFIVGGSVVPELELSWRLTFLIKAIVLVPLLASLTKTPPEHINDPGATDTHRHAKHEAAVAREKGRSPAPQVSMCRSVMRNASTLLRNELFVCAVMGLVVLYFVVTAMQVFITTYLRGPPFYASMHTIVFGFGAASVTAPVLGVVSGGLILDKLGGYQTNLRRAAVFGASCGTLAAWFALLACYMTTVPTFIAALWCMLFVGAANVPVGTGILMAAVAPSMRPTASSYAAVAFNIFGYFLGPIFCGFVADRTGSLATAFHIVLMMSGVGCIPLGLTVIFASNHKVPADDDEYIEDFDVDPARIPRPDETSTPTVVDEHSAAVVLSASFVVSVPSTPQRTPQRATASPGGSAFANRGGSATPRAAVPLDLGPSATEVGGIADGARLATATRDGISPLVDGPVSSRGSSSRER